MFLNKLKSKCGSESNSIHWVWQNLVNRKTNKVDNPNRKQREAYKRMLCYLNVTLRVFFSLITQ